MIVRIWHGWATPADADVYQRLLDTEIVPGIVARQIPGLHNIDILRRRETVGDEVEFATIMVFDDWAAVEAFAGTEGTGSVVPPRAREVLARFDEHSRHYDLVASHVNRVAGTAP